MFQVNPLSIALQGVYPTTNALNMIVQGWMVELVVEEIKLPSIRPKTVITNVGGGFSSNPIYRQPVPKKIKVVRVTCEKDGVTIKKSKVLTDVNVSIKDIEIQLVEGKERPTIKIKLINE